MLMFIFCSQVTVAHTDLSTDGATDNILTVIEKLSKSIPGGGDNIRQLHLKCDNSPALPIYISDSMFLDFLLHVPGCMYT